MKLQELLDSDVEYEVIKKTSTRFTTKATINGRDVKFSAQTDGADEEGTEESWDISFFEIKDSPIVKFGKTGSGGEFDVATFVSNSIKEFVQTYHPSEISFSADKDQGENRARIYAKMASKVLKGYQRIKVPNDHEGTEQFVYSRID